MQEVCPPLIVIFGCVLSALVEQLDVGVTRCAFRSMDVLPIRGRLQTSRDVIETSSRPGPNGGHALPGPEEERDAVDRILLTPTEAARALGIGRSKLYELMREGSIRSIRIGACRRVPTTALDEFVLAAGDSDER